MAKTYSYSQFCYQMDYHNAEYWQTNQDGFDAFIAKMKKQYPVWFAKWERNQIKDHESKGWCFSATDIEILLDEF